MDKVIKCVEPLFAPIYTDPHCAHHVFYPQKKERQRGSGVPEVPAVSGLWPHHLAAQKTNGWHTDEELSYHDPQKPELYLGTILACPRAFVPGNICINQAPKFAESITKNIKRIEQLNQEAGGKALDPTELVRLATPPVSCVVDYTRNHRLAEIKNKLIGERNREEVISELDERDKLNAAKQTSQFDTTMVLPLLFEPFFKERETNDLNFANYHMLADRICQILSGGKDKIDPISSYEKLGVNLDKFRELFNPARIVSLLNKMESDYVGHESDELKQSMRNAIQAVLVFLSNCPFLGLYNIINGVDSRLVLQSFVGIRYKDSCTELSFVSLYNDLANRDMSNQDLLKTKTFKRLIRNREKCDPSAFDTLEEDRIAICEAIAEWLEKSTFGAGTYTKEQEAEMFKGYLKNARSIMRWYKDYAEKYMITDESSLTGEQTTEASAIPTQE